ncbi:MAG: hypothetical protein AAB263_20770 [Planctomycetota bacterium]
MMNRRFLVGLTLASAASAVELPGVPGPPRLGFEDASVAWGNDAFGPGGGGESDDFRTNEIALTWTYWNVVFGLDHSILTTSNPSGSPVLWGYPDPYAARRVGAARRDELVATVGLRSTWERGPMSGWLQGGGGVLVAGNLSGQATQNATHGLLGIQSMNLAYEHPSRPIEALAYVGTGMDVAVSGPLHVSLGALSTGTTDRTLRWRGEALAVVGGPGGGMWFGCNYTGHHDDGRSVVAAVVADHEDGFAVVAGISVDWPTWRLSLETTRIQHNDAQVGRLTLAWIPEQGGSASGTDAPWIGRSAIVAADTRVQGRGIDWMIGRQIGDGSWKPSWRFGLRDQEFSVPFNYDIEARRTTLWTGIGVGPELGRRGSVRFVGDAEVGVGWRHDRVVSTGFLEVDGGEGKIYDLPVLRAAAGVGALWQVTNGCEAGVLAMVELAAAPSRSSTLVVLEPYTNIERKRAELAVDGSGAAALLGVSVAWRW